LKQAVLHDPTRMVTHRNLAAALFATGNLEASLAELTIAAELEPDDWATRRNMGMVLQKAGKHSESIESYRRALELRPNDLATYGAIATSFDELKQRDKAIETLEHGLSLAVAAGDDANAELLRNQLKKMREVEKPMPTQLKSPALESPSKQNDVQLIPFKPTITV
jgi:tetratricopeptide (TPR) repeat protein